MKKFFSFAAFALLMTTMALSLAACGGSDDDDDNGGDVKVSQLVGKWIAVQYKKDEPNAEYAEWTQMPFKMQFNGNGTFSSVGLVGSASGNYIYEDGVIKTFKENSNIIFLSYKVLSLKDDIVEFYVENVGAYGNLYLRCARMPENTVQAAKMLYGQWRKPSSHYFADETYYDFSDVGVWYEFCKIKSDPVAAGLYSDYAGKYVGYEHYTSFGVSYGDPDASAGQIYPGANTPIPFTDLNAYSMTFDGIKLIRVNKPIKYTVVEKRGQG